MKKLYFWAVACCLTLTACEDVPAPYELFDPKADDLTTLIAPAGAGTVADPYNVAMLNEILDNQQETTEAVYFKGIVCKVPSIDTSYGNATYHISDDGKTNVTFEVYRGYSLGGAKFKSEDELQMNDTVVVQGVLTNYNGTYETTAGSSIYSINGRTAGGSTPDTPAAEPKGNGTADDPFNVSGIINYTKSLGADKNSDKDVHFKGIVSTVKEISPVGSYNNATFYISDDGKASNEFYIYRCLGFNKGNITSADMIKVGDEVEICGKVVYFKGNTPETVQKEAYLVSVNGEGGSVDPTPGPDVPAGDAQSVTIADFLAKKDVNTTYRLAGKIVNVVAGKEQYGNFDLQDATGSVYIYGLVDASGKYTFQEHGLAEGDSLVLEGKYAEFNGKAEVNKALYISHVKAGGETPFDPTPDTPPVEEGEYITFDVTANCFNIPSDKQTTAGTYTCNNYSITLTPSEGFNYYFNTKDKYVILGKKGATIEFNGFDFDVEKIVIMGRAGASANTLQNMYVGDEAVSTQTKGTIADNTYVIKEGYRAAGTHYVLRVESEHNTQFTGFKIYKAK